MGAGHGWRCFGVPAWFEAALASAVRDETDDGFRAGLFGGWLGVEDFDRGAHAFEGEVRLALDHADGGVAEEIADFGQRDARRDEPSGAGVTEVVGGEVMNLRAAAGGGKGLIDAGDAPTVRVAEDPPGSGAVLANLHGAAGEGAAGGGVERDAAPADALVVLGIEADPGAEWRLKEVDRIPGTVHSIGG
jgi:hypothetical protein